MQTSIVSGSIKAAIEGHYGDYQFTSRTSGSELWINPLMSIYWCFRFEFYFLLFIMFRLQHVAKRLISLKEVKQVKNYYQLSGAIYENEERKKAKLRKYEHMPL